MIGRRNNPVFAARSFDPTIVRRVQRIDGSLLPEYLINTIMGLGYVVDQWRFHDGPMDEVQQGIDSLIALWSEIELREGLTEHIKVEYGPEDEYVAGANTIVDQSQEPYLDVQP
jgi:hypothetical protein